MYDETLIQHIFLQTKFSFDKSWFYDVTVYTLSCGNALLLLHDDMINITSPEVLLL